MPFCPSKRSGRNQALVERCSATSDASFCGASLAHAWHGSKGSSHARGVAAGCRVIQFCPKPSPSGGFVLEVRSRKEEVSWVSLWGRGCISPTAGWQLPDQSQPRSIREGYPIEQHLFFFSGARSPQRPTTEGEGEGLRTACERLLY